MGGGVPPRSPCVPQAEVIPGLPISDTRPCLGLPPPSAAIPVPSLADVAELEAEEDRVPVLRPLPQCHRRSFVATSPDRSAIFIPASCLPDCTPAGAAPPARPPLPSPSTGCLPAAVAPPSPRMALTPSRGGAGSGGCY